MKHKKKVTEDVVEEAQRRNEELKDQLRSNENYRQISHFEEKLADLVEDTKQATEEWEKLRKVSKAFS